MCERRYLPTFADLVDRLSIVQLKAVYISEHKVEYEKEIELILHDLNVMLDELGEKHVLTAEMMRALLVVMLTNHAIWINESKARAGGDEQNALLKFTHSINGVRNRAKNIINSCFEQRQDLKIDCLAADLPKEFGNWSIF